MNNEANAIDILPHVLIGEIASYLNQTDYAQFSVTNKSILIGCKSPNTLQSLRLYDRALCSKYINIDYSQINLSNFPFIRYLAIGMNKFEEFVFPENKPLILPQLREIEIGLHNNTDIESFMTQNWINLSKISTLKLYCKPAKGVCFFNGEKFWILLSKFSAIKHLHVIDVDVDASIFDEMINDEDIKALLPNLKSLKCIGSSAISNKLVNIFANNLKSLELVRSDIHIENDIQFLKLQQLRIRLAIDEQIEQIMSKSPDLKKVDLFMFIMSAHLMQLLCNSPTLTYIKMANSLYYPCKQVFNGVENLLKIRSENFKKDIRIEMHMYLSTINSTADTCMARIERLIHVLSNTKPHALHIIIDPFPGFNGIHKAQIDRAVEHFKTAEETGIESDTNIMEMNKQTHPHRVPFLAYDLKRLTLELYRNGY